jgi:uncharacterized protein (TIGR04540 family)
LFGNKNVYKSQVEVSTAINELIDAYWDDQIAEEVLLKNINKMVEYNKSKILKDDDFTTILKQKCGKKKTRDSC